MLGRVKRLKEQIDQSQNIILINLDSQRNIMLRLSLQLAMGTFSLTLGGLMGVAFGMNLDSSLEEVWSLYRYLSLYYHHRINMHFGLYQELC